MNIEWVFVQDLYPRNPVVDTEHDVRITVPVVRVEALRDALELIADGYFESFNTQGRLAIERVLQLLPEEPS